MSADRTVSVERRPFFNLDKVKYTIEPGASASDLVTDTWMLLDTGLSSLESASQQIKLADFENGPFWAGIWLLRQALAVAKAADAALTQERGKEAGHE